MLFNFLRRGSSNNRPVIVKFAGGMGTQILQAATFLHLRGAGREVYADLSYFDRPLRLAMEGDRGVATHWHWQLDHYGLTQDFFLEAPKRPHDRSCRIIADGAEMMKIGIAALTQNQIRRQFDDPIKSPLVSSSVAEGSFFCVHIRRGDYLNVASHLLTDEYFISISKKFSKLFYKAVVLSDSLLGNSLKKEFMSIFPDSIFLDQADPKDCHRIMRNAAALVCSNSTFSLTAGLLNADGLVFLPKKWFAEKDFLIEKPIHDHCSLELLS